MAPTMWDERFSKPDYYYGTEPNAFVATQKARLKPGWQALCPGDGEGRNGVWLAGQGISVLSVDASEVGLRKTEELAKAKGVPIATHCADLLTWEWPKARFDLVVAVFLHVNPEMRPGLHQSMLTALKPGGLLVLEGFRKAQVNYGTGGPRDPQMLFSAEALASDFAEADILELNEVLRDLAEGAIHQGTAALVNLVARRPLI